jgi:hypothetical protein
MWLDAAGPKVLSPLARRMGPQAVAATWGLRSAGMLSIRFSKVVESQPDAHAFRLIKSQTEMVTRVDFVAAPIRRRSRIDRTVAVG